MQRCLKVRGESNKMGHEHCGAAAAPPALASAEAIASPRSARQAECKSDGGTLTDVIHSVSIAPAMIMPHTLHRQCRERASRATRCCAARARPLVSLTTPTRCAPTSRASRLSLSAAAASARLRSCVASSRTRLSTPRCPRWALTCTWCVCEHFNVHVIQDFTNSKQALLEEANP
jgi:hypothetical protein